MEPKGGCVFAQTPTPFFWHILPNMPPTSLKKIPNLIHINEYRLSGMHVILKIMSTKIKCEDILFMELLFYLF